jgi:hypothetical protein
MVTLTRLPYPSFSDTAVVLHENCVTCQEHIDAQFATLQAIALPRDDNNLNTNENNNNTLFSDPLAGVITRRGPPYILTRWLDEPPCSPPWTYTDTIASIFANHYSDEILVDLFENGSLDGASSAGIVDEDKGKEKDGSQNAGQNSRANNNGLPPERSAWVAFGQHLQRIHRNLRLANSIHQDSLAIIHSLPTAQLQGEDSTTVEEYPKVLSLDSASEKDGE